MFLIGETQLGSSISHIPHTEMYRITYLFLHNTDTGKHNDSSQFFMSKIGQNLQFGPVIYNVYFVWDAHRYVFYT